MKVYCWFLRRIGPVRLLGSRKSAQQVLKSAGGATEAVTRITRRRASAPHCAAGGVTVIDDREIVSSVLIRMRRRRYLPARSVGASLRAAVHTKVWATPLVTTGVLLLLR